MSSDGNSSLREEVEGEFEEQKVSIEKLVETLIESFLRSSSDYGAIADIKTNIDQIYLLVRKHIEKKKLDLIREKKAKERGKFQHRIILDKIK